MIISRTRPWKRLAVVGLIVLAVAVPAAIWLRTIWLQGDADDGHGELAAAFESLELPGYTLVAEQRFGSSGCLLGDCPRVDRYYASPDGVAETCAAVSAAVTAWAPGASVIEEGGCDLSGRRDSHYLTVSVSETADIEPEPDQVESPAIEVDYASIVIVGLSAEG